MNKNFKIKEGKYSPNQVNDLVGKSQFTVEKPFVDFIEKNIVEFCSMIGEQYSSHTREWTLGLPMNSPVTGKWSMRARIDIMVETIEGKRIGIECKVLKGIFYPSSRSISQLLSYYVLAESLGVKFDRMILACEKVDPVMIRVIERFRLPIEILVVSKSFMALWQGKK